ncbi:tetratricopeptide repeat protein [Cryptosporangium japonicum]|uniref:FxSxx-COOH system tetratricopeptide repeat protein n=1 Tax=Cryptosporangium japonicum TaxID=80872 RepID=A0ABN0UPE0_9ACTN
MSSAPTWEWDYFVSFTQADEGWARWAAEVLEAAAYLVIWQHSRFVVGSEWPALMRSAAVGARVTVAVLSPEYFRAQFSMEEWRLARAEERRDGLVRLFPILVADPPADCPEWQAEFGGRVWLDLRDLDRQAARERFLDALDAARWGHDPLGVPLTNTRPADPTVSIARPDLLAAIRRTLEPADPAVVVLSGAPGIGKSTLAAEYARAHARDYRIIWWIESASETLVRARLAELAGELGLAGNTSGAAPLDRVLRGLGGRHRWLLVYDDVDVANVDVERLLPHPGGSLPAGGHVIVTTRAERRVLPGVAAEIAVPKLSVPESVDFLRRGFRGPEGSAEWRPTDQQVCERLASLFDGLPLALAQAVRSTPSPDEYLVEFEVCRTELLDADVVPSYGVSVGAAFRTALGRVDPESAALLRILAALGSAPIPVELLEATAEELNAPLDTVVTSPVRLKRAVRPLTDRGLARHYADPTSARRLISVHAVTRTVQADVATQHGNWDDSVRAAVRMLDTIAGSARADSPTARSWWQRILPHALTAAEYPIARQEVLDGDVLPPAVTILLGASRYLRWRGEPSEAVVLSRRALALADDYLRSRRLPEGADAAHAVATCRHALADDLVADGRHLEALEALAPALDRWTETLGPSPVTAEALLTKATALDGIRRYRDAETALEEAIRIIGSVYGPDSPTLEPYLSNLAVLRHHQRRPDQALSVVRRAEAVAQGGADDAGRRARRSEIHAAALWGIGRRADAVEMFRRAAEMIEASYGRGHPRTLAAHRNADRAEAGN